ncbi:heavy-metal-associated domain-containing protein [Microbacterium saccharophilum]|uniref:Heavy-metal-associated domain-containing protein n=1 Tax=Microbacterium saccharophilum TaxID=1213358 RepID=A0A5C8HX38_9MICO|nr:heavy-metal-associated domain-containing protein [Microbacterium saccharophilum]TXK10683.1 heavy-metal-associated domain-containing protein [Microbacterium saccharophilum]GEP48240.1 metal-binding protein [Microbacterium saccharophilum]
MSTQAYTVEGMTCGHCAAAVTREVSAVAGVSEVAVDVAAKTVTVTGDAMPADEAIAAAVAEAGYSLTGRR